MSVEDTKTKRRKFRKTLNKIQFETEIVTKDAAKRTLEEKEVVEPLLKASKKLKPVLKPQQDETPVENQPITLPKREKKSKSQRKAEKNSVIEGNEATSPQSDLESNTTKAEPQKDESKRAKKRKKHEKLSLEKKVKGDVEIDDKCLNNISTPVENQPTKLIKRDKKRKNQSKPEQNSVIEGIEETPQIDVVSNITKPEAQKEESKRAKKRKKYEQLLLEKKVKVDVEVRDKCLNYISRWKHNRNDWKFEKLRQVWLQQNMFESEKVPKESWNTLMEYFDNSKGNIRQKIIEDALKLVEQGEQVSEPVEGVNEKSTNGIKLKRARDAIQYLQT